MSIPRVGKVFVSFPCTKEINTAEACRWGRDIKAGTFRRRPCGLAGDVTVVDRNDPQNGLNLFKPFFKKCLTFSTKCAIIITEGKGRRQNEEVAPREACKSAV